MERSARVSHFCTNLLHYVDNNILVRTRRPYFGLYSSNLSLFFAANHAHSQQVQPGSGPADGGVRQRHREGLQSLQRGGAYLHIDVSSRPALLHPSSLPPSYTPSSLLCFPPHCKPALRTYHCLPLLIGSVAGLVFIL